MKDRIEPLTLAQLEALAHAVKGFVGEPWGQGEVGESYDVPSYGEGRGVVVDDDDNPLIDCSGHDCGPDMAAALVLMHNTFPALFNMARGYAKRKTETYESLELLAQAVKERNEARLNAYLLAESHVEGITPHPDTMKAALAYPIAQETSHAS